MAIQPIAAIGGATIDAGRIATQPVPGANSVQGQSFTDLVSAGLEGVDIKVAKADALLKAYALGDPIPVHQVTIALEEARLAVELAVQVRERLTETYRSFMNLQL